MCVFRIKALYVCIVIVCVCPISFVRSDLGIKRWFIGNMNNLVILSILWCVDRCTELDFYDQELHFNVNMFYRSKFNILLYFVNKQKKHNNCLKKGR